MTLYFGRFTVHIFLIKMDQNQILGFSEKSLLGPHKVQMSKVGSREIDMQGVGYFYILSPQYRESTRRSCDFNNRYIKRNKYEVLD